MKRRCEMKVGYHLVSLLIVEYLLETGQIKITSTSQRKYLTISKREALVVQWHSILKISFLILTISC